MKTKDLGLKTDQILTDSSHIIWHKNGQMWWRYEMKDGKFHGDSKSWFMDGSLWSHKVWENGKRVKKIV